MEYRELFASIVYRKNRCMREM